MKKFIKKMVSILKDNCPECGGKAVGYYNNCKRAICKNRHSF